MLLKEIGFDRAVELHRSMWHWLENEFRERRLTSRELDYFDTEEYKSLNIEGDSIPNSECFCCEFACNLRTFMAMNNYREGLYYSICHYCPIKWNDVDWTSPTPGGHPCLAPIRHGGYYRKYINIVDDMWMEEDERCDKLSAIAKVIAERPVREKTKYDIAFDNEILNHTMEDKKDETNF